MDVFLSAAGKYSFHLHSCNIAGTCHSHAPIVFFRIKKALGIHQAHLHTFFLALAYIVHLAKAYRPAEKVAIREIAHKEFINRRKVYAPVRSIGKQVNINRIPK